MSSFKFALLCCISVCGIETVNSELKTLAEDDGPVSWSALRRLRLIQSRLSRGFSRVTEQLRPELISTISYGTLAQVITIFQLIGAAQQDEHIFIWSTILYLVPALVSTLVPCWSCQRVLDASEGTRAALLTVEPQDAPADRQLAALLAATQRDLETFGDLGFFRLQLSAILGTTSTVLTYIIIMVQFQMSENGCGDSGGHQGNTTDAA
ncbi:hypothetical protein FJT64_005402 [Amphibalanus amphitrite]|uniref:Uncharacterized protein n=1 Tax=Amphibalanus amphitrite TaxID=1232801 RepID=A0A6A4W5I4_AMPAM|nr:hypothetical protein FJT64_007304 [Amphibalanus amphitrite]KAF0297151.1 hypothetical protein FJT64_005402 [Amphibalanus amphitrite]